MAAKTVMHDELTGVTLILKDDETTELMTVAVNGREMLLSPEEKHNSLYEVAKTLQGMMRDIKADYVKWCAATETHLSHTQAYVEFNEATLKFTEK